MEKKKETNPKVEKIEKAIDELFAKKIKTYNEAFNILSVEYEKKKNRKETSLSYSKVIRELNHKLVNEVFDDLDEKIKKGL